eukprot:CAMPEP_0184482604 /NCGR_PEP_ID=MMETSP0113_2-20130426/4174_1 /TAXON_ID=91329 /ORGANISM="Norrisiella sphaerica, Strain BC52" /LENGTH=542 /DNA_ID=CAMNT_0026862437 /DNA_START=114 /DNA_END=1742 /DNA_ORIENTATION=-
MSNNKTSWFSSWVSKRKGGPNTAAGARNHASDTPDTTGSTSMNVATNPEQPSSSSDHLASAEKESVRRAETTGDLGVPRKKSWGIFGWGSSGNSRNSNTNASEYSDSKSPGSRRGSRASSFLQPLSPAPITPNFEEIDMLRLNFFTQKAEILAELARLEEEVGGRMGVQSARKGGDRKLLRPSGMENVILNKKKWSREREEKEREKIRVLRNLAASMLLFHPPPPAEQVAGRAYAIWTLETLRRSMLLLHGGGYLTPQIFVPSAVWRQEGVRLPRYSEKLAGSSKLLRHLVGFEAEYLFTDPPEPTRIRKRIRKINSDLADMRSQLALALPEVKAEQEEVLERRATSLGSFGLSIFKGTSQLRSYAMQAKLSVEESQSYISLLVAVSEKAEELLEKLSGSPNSADKAGATRARKVVDATATPVSVTSGIGGNDRHLHSQSNYHVSANHAKGRAFTEKCDRDDGAARDTKASEKKEEARDERLAGKGEHEDGKAAGRLEAEVRDMLDNVLRYLREVVCVFNLSDLRKLVLQYKEANERDFLLD